MTPGEYIVKIKGTATESGQEEFSTIKFTFVDPCDPPESIVAPAFDHQVYTITDTSYPDYTHLDFIISPDYCKIDYTYELGSITDASN